MRVCLHLLFLFFPIFFIDLIWLYRIIVDFVCRTTAFIFHTHPSIQRVKQKLVKMREIVHLQAGQCGNQIGAKVCTLFYQYFIFQFEQHQRYCVAKNQENHLITKLKLITKISVFCCVFYCTPLHCAGYFLSVQMNCSVPTHHRNSIWSSDTFRNGTNTWKREKIELHTNTNMSLNVNDKYVT